MGASRLRAGWRCACSTGQGDFSLSQGEWTAVCSDGAESEHATATGDMRGGHGDRPDGHRQALRDLEGMAMMVNEPEYEAVRGVLEECAGRLCGSVVSLVLQQVLSKGVTFCVWPPCDTPVSRDSLAPSLMEWTSFVTTIQRLQDPPCRERAILHSIRYFWEGLAALLLQPSCDLHTYIRTVQKLAHVLPEMLCALDKWGKVDDVDFLAQADPAAAACLAFSVQVTAPHVPAERLQGLVSCLQRFACEPDRDAYLPSVFDALTRIWQSDWTLDHSNHAAQQDLSECISATGAIMLQVVSLCRRDWSLEDESYDAHWLAMLAGAVGDATSIPIEPRGLLGCLQKCPHALSLYVKYLLGAFETSVCVLEWLGLEVMVRTISTTCNECWPAFFSQLLSTLNPEHNSSLNTRLACLKMTSLLMNNFQDQAIDWPESTLRILVFVLLHDSSVKIRQAAIGVLPAYQATWKDGIAGSILKCLLLKCRDADAFVCEEAFRALAKWPPESLKKLSSDDWRSLLALVEAISGTATEPAPASQNRKHPRPLVVLASFENILKGLILHKASLDQESPLHVLEATFTKGWEEQPECAGLELYEGCCLKVVQEHKDLRDMLFSRLIHSWL